MILLFNINDSISFKYKGRKVKLVVNIINPLTKKCSGILKTDYIGKNEEWFKGENKSFNLNEMKNIIINK